MGVIIGMFSQFARLGVTRAAAFFYAVAVGVAANIVIAHFTPHDDVLTTPPAAPSVVVKPATAPVATAIITAKPVEPPKPVEVSVPVPAPALPPAPVVTAPALNGAMTPPTAPPAAIQPLPAAILSAPSTMAPPPLKPAALPST
ncbi:MAG TPA: hypothetical protein VM782_11840, partial [Stellaceae bacterium]|nr:hypothetical protein [Stellaceae bacterium]